jgi:hypothetical protein
MEGGSFILIVVSQCNPINGAVVTGGTVRGVIQYLAVIDITFTIVVITVIESNPFHDIYVLFQIILIE